MLITIAVCAMAEVARPLRFLNLAFVLWLIVAPWLLGFQNSDAMIIDVVIGMAVAVLAGFEVWLTRDDKHRVTTSG